MSARRVDNSPEDQAAKHASQQLVRAAGGTEAAEGYCRANFRRLSEYGRPDNDCFMPVDVVRDLEAVTHGTPGYPIVTRYLADRAGYVLVAKPALEVSAGISLQVACAAHAKEHGEATARVIALLGRSQLRREEIAATIAEVDQGIEESVKLRAMLAALASEAE